MLFEIKVLNVTKKGETARCYLSCIEDAKTSKEVLDEVFRGRQAVGNNNQTAIRCGPDDKFFNVTLKSDIIRWVDQRLKAGR
jgi:hypothetical protein